MRDYLWGAVLLLALFDEAAFQSPTHSAGTHQVPTLPPSVRPTSTAGLTSEQVNKAAKLWIAKCARCHPLYDPGFYNDVDWGSWMTKMSRKAHLKAEQEELLRIYLGAFRAP